MPNYPLWPLKDLKTEGFRFAGSRQGLKFGPGMEDYLKRISNQKKQPLVNALVKRCGYRKMLGLDAEWVNTPVGITPPPKKEQQHVQYAKAVKKAGRGNGRGVVTPVQTYCCRMVCLTLHADMFKVYLRSRGGSVGLSRDEQDAGAMGAKHAFYVTLAKAMAKECWKDGNGNPLSVPDKHANDSRAPDTLKNQLDTLDLVGAATALQAELRDMFQNDEKTFYFDLQRRLYSWLKDVKKEHTVSGYVGVEK